MFAGYVLPEAKLTICGRLTESPLQISTSGSKKNWRFLAKLELKIGLQNTVLKGVSSSIFMGEGDGGWG